MTHSEFQVVTFYKEGCHTRSHYQFLNEAQEVYEKRKNHPHAVAGELLRIIYKEGLFGTVSVKSVYRVMDWAKWENE